MDCETINIECINLVTTQGVLYLMEVEQVSNNLIFFLSTAGSYLIFETHSFCISSS